MLVEAYSVATTPAFAIDTVSCSMHSCNTERTVSSNLSNSSSAHSPLLHRTSAPGSKRVFSPERLTNAVRPAELEFLPDV